MKNFHPVRHFHWAVGVVATLSLAVMFYSVPLLRPQGAGAFNFTFINTLASLIQSIVPSTCSGEGASNDPSLSSTVTSDNNYWLEVDMNADVGRTKRLVVCGKDYNGAYRNNTFPNGGRVQYLSFRKSSSLARMEIRIIADGALIVRIADINNAARVGTNSNGWYFSDTYVTSTIPILFREYLEVHVKPLSRTADGAGYNSSDSKVRVAAYVSAEPMMRIEKLMRETNSNVVPTQYMKYVLPSGNTAGYYDASEPQGVRLMKASGNSYVAADPLSVKFDSTPAVTISGTVSVSCTSGCL